MENRPKQSTVLVKRCEEYDQTAIMKLFRDGMKTLGFAPRGKVFVKPNVVFSTKDGKYGSTAYTDPSVIGASLLALSTANGVKRVDLGEKTAIGYPTRLTYKNAGYYDVIKTIRPKTKAPVRIFCIDEHLRERVFIGGKVHDTLKISRKMSRANCKIYLPKLKCHCVSSMTGAVKLNIGICSDDERAIRHDFLLNDKIVDLLEVGTPDFILMDAIDVGVGNEAFPTPRKLGLVIMGTNPLAVDIVGARLLGYDVKDVPYLQRAIERGYTPPGIADINITGDLHSAEDLDEAAKRLLPYDDEYYQWQDIEKDLARLKSPIRFYWGYTNKREQKKCYTGCIMGIKMFFAFLERYAGRKAFQNARPAVMVVGDVDGTIDARGQEAFLIGSCSKANIVNAQKITKIDNCFTTAVDLAQTIRGRLGIPAPILDKEEVLPLVKNFVIATGVKLLSLRYLQDIGYFLKRGLQKRI